MESASSLQAGLRDTGVLTSIRKLTPSITRVSTHAHTHSLICIHPLYNLSRNPDVRAWKPHIYMHFREPWFLPPLYVLRTLSGAKEKGDTRAPPRRGWET